MTMEEKLKKGGRDGLPVNEEEGDEHDDQGGREDDHHDHVSRHG